MGGVDFSEVWGPPGTIAGRLVQVGFLSTLLGAVPLAILGYVLRRICRGRQSTGWAWSARIGTALQVVSILSTLLLCGLLFVEASETDLFGDLILMSPMLALIWVNLVSAAWGLQAWRVLARETANAG